jgi:hypothetical protein
VASQAREKELFTVSSFCIVQWKGSIHQDKEDEIVIVVKGQRKGIDTVSSFCIGLVVSFSIILGQTMTIVTPDSGSFIGLPCLPLLLCRLSASALLSSS